MWLTLIGILSQIFLIDIRESVEYLTKFKINVS